MHKAAAIALPETFNAAAWFVEADADWWTKVTLGPPGFAAYARVLHNLDEGAPEQNRGQWVLAFDGPCGRIKQLVADLNADDWKQRDRAEEGLKSMGPVAIGVLKQLGANQPPEAQQRIDSIVKELEKERDGAKAPGSKPPAAGCGTTGAVRRGLPGRPRRGRTAALTSRPLRH